VEIQTSRKNNHNKQMKPLPLLLLLAVLVAIGRCVPPMNTGGPYLVCRCLGRVVVRSRLPFLQIANPPTPAAVSRSFRGEFFEVLGPISTSQ
jgi:hypothetical protein